MSEAHEGAAPTGRDTGQYIRLGIMQQIQVMNRNPIMVPRRTWAGLDMPQVGDEYELRSSREPLCTAQVVSLGELYVELVWVREVNGG